MLKISLEAYTQQPSVVRCTRPNCEGLLEVPVGGDERPAAMNFTCPVPSCRRSMCARCKKSPYHEGLSCQASDDKEGEIEILAKGLAKR